MIPPLEPNTGALPPGRYRCSLAEFETAYVDAPDFDASTTRREIYDHFQKTYSMLSSLVAVEAVWIGGSFVTSEANPDDIDCLFHINAEAFKALPSNSKRNQIREFSKKGRVREKLGYRIEPFVMVRDLFANPWSKGGVSEAATPFFALRGAWDDWWQRERSDPDRSAAPALVDAGPTKGYLEVTYL
ncbi:DUF6932 family protein [Specibacter sp. RAF43]|uniref:DUF6932 family protein n=1 Tax=Specibacter sp. RAF43 TaxID=3233057 RepID=UPI003F9EB459